MAKVSNLLKDIRDRFNGFDNTDVFYSLLNYDEDTFKEFLSIFNDVEDSRVNGRCTYSTLTIVGIVFMGLLHNMDTWTEIASLAQIKSEFMGKYIDLSKGIPSHDTLERVFSLIHSDTLEDALIEFIQRSIHTTAKILELNDKEMKLLAIDGKELKGSGRKYNTDEKIRNTQIMHFYDTSTGVCIKSQLIEEKTNEIPTAQNVLRSLNIKGMIVTSDAMNCQKDTVSVIVNGKGHYVLGLKGNHSELHEEVKKQFIRKTKYNKSSYYRMTTDKNHNQVEIREFYKIPAKDVYGSEEWLNIKSIVMYKKTITHTITNESKEEKRFYITDLNDLELISQSIRRHWAVENELHWHMDVNLNEDSNKTVNRTAINNLSIMKKNILTILKLLQPLFGNNSIKTTRKLFAADYDKNMIKLFALLDEYNLKQLIKKHEKK